MSSNRAEGAKNKKIKIYICMKFDNAPNGGSFQFTKALKKYFVINNVYTDNVDNADVILFNSFQFNDEVLRLKLKYPNKIFIHRVDGPIKLYNHKKDLRENLLYAMNRAIADGTVFQSNWSKDHNFIMGLWAGKFNRVILNSVDKDIFNIDHEKKFDRNKVNIIATSWSSNLKKGFDVYKWMDQNLDFRKINMTFVGNSPIAFNNIKSIKPLDSVELSKTLKENDIYITASRSDPCSNSLIEALHCGLPAIAYRDGGHPEIIKDSGCFFEHNKEILECIENVIENYDSYRRKINVLSINEVADNYYNFSECLWKYSFEGKLKVKKISVFSIIIIKIKFILFLLKLSDKYK